MTGSQKRKVNQYLDRYLKYQDVRKCKDEEHQSAGAEHDAEPVEFPIVLDQILRYGYGGHDDEDHAQRGLEDEYVPPAALQGAQEARGEEPEDEPDGLARCEDGDGAVFERPAEVATEDAHACRATGIRRTHGAGQRGGDKRTRGGHHRRTYPEERRHDNERDGLWSINPSMDGNRRAKSLAYRW